MIPHLHGRIFCSLQWNSPLLPNPSNSCYSSLYVFSVILYSAFSFLLDYSIKSLKLDTTVNYMPNPTSFSNISNPTTSNNLKADAAFSILPVKIFFILAISAVDFLSTTISTILVSAASSYSAKSLTIKEITSTICKIWTKPLITSFYIGGLSIGCKFLGTKLLTRFMIFNGPIIDAIGILLGLLAITFYLYLLVSCELFVVISAVEENCYGLEALVKAVGLAKGKRLQGFLLCVGYYLVSEIVVPLFNSILENHLYVYKVAAVVVSYVAYFFLVVAYTVLYFECKKFHKE